MKSINIFHILFLLLSLTACSKNENIEDSDKISSTVISLNPYIESSTRAADINSQTLKNQTFLSFASYTNDFKWDDSDKSPNFIYNGKFKYKDDGWAFDIPRYWPLSGYVTFWACSSDAGVKPDTQSPFIDYTVSDNLTEQSDLLGSIVMDMKKTDNGKVNFIFKHLLSKISFIAKIASDCEVKSVTIDRMAIKYGDSKIKKIGQYNFDSDSWKLNGDNYMNGTNELAFKNGSVIISKEQYSLINSPEEYLMLLPQETESGTFIVDLDYTTIYDDGISVKNTKKNIALPACIWEKGKQYAYSITINMDELKFGVQEISDWEKTYFRLDDPNGDEVLKDNLELLFDAKNSPYSFNNKTVKDAVFTVSDSKNATISVSLSDDKYFSSVVNGNNITFSTKQTDAEAKQAVATIHVKENDKESTYLINLRQVAKPILYSDNTEINSTSTIKFKSTTELYDGKKQYHTVTGIKISPMSSSKSFNVSTLNNNISFNANELIPLSDIGNNEQTYTVTLTNELNETGVYNIKLIQYALPWCDYDGSLLYWDQKSYSSTATFSGTFPNTKNVRKENPLTYKADRTSSSTWFWEYKYSTLFYAPKLSDDNKITIDYVPKKMGILLTGWAKYDLMVTLYNEIGETSIYTLKIERGLTESN